MQIYVGNLPLECTDAELRAMFEPFGKVKAAAIGRDKKTDASLGYGFVEMLVKSEARAAIEALRGKDMQGKPLRVDALKPGDEFFQHANALQHSATQKGAGGFKGAQPFVKASGAIRRGGKRGS